MHDKLTMTTTASRLLCYGLSKQEYRGKTNYKEGSPSGINEEEAWQIKAHWLGRPVIQYLLGWVLNPVQFFVAPLIDSPTVDASKLEMYDHLHLS